jgi:hypothetical protein
MTDDGFGKPMGKPYSECRHSDPRVVAQSLSRNTLRQGAGEIVPLIINENFGGFPHPSLGRDRK